MLGGSNCLTRHYSLIDCKVRGDSITSQRNHEWGGKGGRGTGRGCDIREMRTSANKCHGLRSSAWCLALIVHRMCHTGTRTTEVSTILTWDNCDSTLSDFFFNVFITLYYRAHWLFLTPVLYDYCLWFSISISTLQTVSNAIVMFQRKHIFMPIAFLLLLTFLGEFQNPESESHRWDWTG